MNFSAELPTLNVSKIKRAYLVGIKGVGMAALALLFQQRGIVVSGADADESFVTDSLLSEHNIEIDTFTSALIPEKTDLVVYSGAHQGKNNPLVIEAQRRDIPVTSHAQALGLLSSRKQTVAVAGVGGKSTTSALLSWMLESGGLRPSYAIGVGSVPNLGSSGRWNPDSDIFVVEADEYVADPTQDITPRFLYLRPKHIICTSLNFDHPDVYSSFADTKKAFSSLFSHLKANSVLVFNGDMPALSELVASQSGKFRRISVGERPHNQVRVVNFAVQEGVGQITLNAPGMVIDGLVLRSRIPGKHNLLNAAYAAVLAVELGVDPSAAAQASASFRSTKRRFEYIGETVRGCQCYDDYAHHPREIEAVGEALHDWFPQKHKVVAFEPHTFSRTKALYEEFLSSLASLDAPVFLLPIFASAREAFDPTITSEMMVDDLQKRGVQAEYCPDRQALLEYVQALGDETVFVTLGAGTIYKVYDDVNFLSTPESLS